MTAQRIPVLNWIPGSPDFNDHVAIVECDANIADEFIITPLGTAANDHSVKPRFAVVDNLSNYKAVSFSYGPYAISVPAYTRNVIKLPNSLSDIRVLVDTGFTVLMLSENQYFPDIQDQYSIAGFWNMTGYVPRDGSLPMQADFDFGGFKGINLSLAVSDTDALSLADMKAGGISVHQSVNQNIPAGVTTKLIFDNEEWDYSNCYDSATYKFTPPKGKHRTITTVYFSSAAIADSEVYISVFKNGVLLRDGVVSILRNGKTSGVSADIIIDANGTDYFEFYVTQNTGGLLQTNSDQRTTYLQSHRVG